MTDQEKIAFVLGDLVEVFKVIEMEPDTYSAVVELNTGWCGMVATIAGYILKEKYNITGLKVRSHPIHIFLGHNGKNYDTIFPHGYQEDITKLWLLENNGLSTKIVETDVGSEANKGWWDWEFIALARTMYKRHGVNPPNYFGSFIDGAVRETKTEQIINRKIHMENREKAVKFLPKTIPINIKNYPSFFLTLKLQDNLYNNARLLS